MNEQSRPVSGATEDVRVVDLAAFRRARTQNRAPVPPLAALVPTDCGSGWYHDAAIAAEDDAPHAA